MSTLAASIGEVGILQPILVRQVEEDLYELVAGERRWRAARRAGIQTIPAIVQEAEDARSLEHALVENLHREDLNALEEAAAFQQLIDDFGYTHEQVARRVGKSRAAVTNTLRLLQLPASVQRLLAEGGISSGHARALLGTPDRSFQEELAKRTVSEGLSVRTVEDEVRQRLAGDLNQEADAVDPLASKEVGSSQPLGTDDGQPSPTFASTPVSRRNLPAPGIVELEELLATHLNTRVKVDLRATRSRVVVEFSNLEDLERIYKLMVGTS
jgi:ParB family chromosome partitioning protein